MEGIMKELAAAETEVAEARAEAADWVKATAAADAAAAAAAAAAADAAADAAAAAAAAAAACCCLLLLPTSSSHPGQMKMDWPSQHSN